MLYDGDEYDDDNAYLSPEDRASMERIAAKVEQACRWMAVRAWARTALALGLAALVVWRFGR